MEADSRIPLGPKVDGMPQLKSHLLKTRKEDIAENVIRRLLAYAIGRKLTFRDRNEVEEVLSQSKAKDYLLQDIIVLICQSSTFRGGSNHKK